MSERPITLHDCEQGSDEWWALRVGAPSVSSLSRILTPSQLGYSTGARGYISDLVGERMLGSVMDRDGGSIWTEYGKEGEDFGRKWYSWFYDVDVRQVGSITTEIVRTDSEGEPVQGEDGFVTDTFLGSPDGLVGSDGIVEIKCPKATTHMQYLTKHKDLSNEYWLQTQGYLFLTGREWCDLISFNPDLPKKRVRVLPDPKVQEMIERQLQRFFREMATCWRKLNELGEVIEESDELRWDLSASLEEEAA